jgi:prepilin-type N-terminal cleavage/methylation domain-containing protein/prepilin-type processing-associated H-X9-DG protein
MNSKNSGFTLIELLVVIAVIVLVAGIIFPVFSKVRENGRATSCLSNLKQIGTASLMYAQDFDESFAMNRLPDETHIPKPCNDTAMDLSGLEGSKNTWKRAVMPYIKNKQVFRCPSNASADFMGGDESNPGWPPAEKLPRSYAYNGSYFHEKAVCKEGEFQLRPRKLAEIKEPSRLILHLESRMEYSDLGNWAVTWQPDGSIGGTKGALQSHNGACNFVFADSHAARLKLARTCTDKMWLDEQRDPEDFCASGQQFPAEYR